MKSLAENYLDEALTSGSDTHDLVFSFPIRFLYDLGMFWLKAPWILA